MWTMYLLSLNDYVCTCISDMTFLYVDKAVTCIFTGRLYFGMTCLYVGIAVSMYFLYVGRAVTFTGGLYFRYDIFVCWPSNYPHSRSDFRYDVFSDYLQSSISGMTSFVCGPSNYLHSKSDFRYDVFVCGPSDYLQSSIFRYDIFVCVPCSNLA